MKSALLIAAAVTIVWLAAHVAMDVIPDYLQQSEAEQAVAKEFKDPESSKFRNVKRLFEGEFCGEVNTKNGFGAYAGFRAFHAIRKPGGEWGVVIDNDTLKTSRAICGL